MPPQPLCRWAPSTQPCKRKASRTDSIRNNCLPFVADQNAYAKDKIIFMDLKSLTKQYSNGTVTVVWKPGLCIHSTICWKGSTGLLDVFNPKVKPWINISGASSERIVEQVRRCPSGALSF